MNAKSIAVAVLLILGAAACQNDEIQSPQVQKSPLPMDAYMGDETGSSSNARVSGSQSITSEYLDAINVGLASAGMDYRVVMAEYVTGAGDKAGATVVSKDVGNKQLALDFVPFDPRRAGTPTTNGGWSGSVTGPDDDITYAVDQLGGAIDGLTQAQTNAAIDAAMATWEAATCSDLPIFKNPDFGGKSVV